MKPLPVQPVPIAPCLLHVAPYEERASVLFVATLKYWNTVMRSPDELSFLQGKKDLTSLVFPHREGSSVL